MERQIKNLDFIEYEVAVGTVNMKKKLLIFDPNRHSKWHLLAVQRDWERACPINQWNTGQLQHESLQLILIGRAYVIYENYLQQLGVISEDNVGLAVENMIAVFLGSNPRRELRKQLEIKKPKNITVSQHAIKYRDTVDLMTYLPNGNNVGLPEGDQVDKFICSMPEEWQTSLSRSGKTLTTMEDAVTYFSEQEAHEKRKTQKLFRPKSKEQKKQHPKKFNKKKFSKTESKCRLHPNSMHTNEECRQQKKNQNDTVKAQGKRHENNEIAKDSDEDEDFYTIEHEANIQTPVDNKKTQLEEIKSTKRLLPTRGEKLQTIGQTNHLNAKILITINEKKGKTRTINCLLDTGASSSFIREDQLSHNAILEPSATKFTTVKGKVQTKGTCTITFQIPTLSSQRSITHKFHVLKTMNHKAIIGRDIMTNLGLNICFKNATIKWDHLEAKFSDTQSQAELIQAKIINTQAREPIHVQKMQENANRILDSKYEAMNPDEKLQHLSPAQQESMKQILVEYKELYDGHLGKANGEPYHIPMKPNATPYYQKPFPIPLIHQATLKKEIERLISLGVLERDTHSPWGAPTFIIPKKNERVRLVTDYRQLNKKIQRQPFPIPRIAGILQDIGKPTYLTSIDMNMGYYQIPLDQESTRYTAFTLPWGKFHYLRLPMGIITAPDEFQSRMSNIFANIPEVIVYLDDILICTQDTFEHHLEILHKALQTLQDNGYTINGQKSLFAVKEIEYLGYDISTEGIKPQQKKVQAILNIDPPKNKRQLRRFIGMVNYYKDTFRLRSHLMSSLTSMTSKNCQFQWTDEHQSNFDQVKNAIAKATLLKFPNMNEPFIIHTDASQLQLGGIISQNNAPISFYSRKLTPAQKRYSVMELELLSIIEILKEFRGILLGRQIIIYTDHKNLSFGTNKNPKIQRWRMLIEEFTPEIRYIKGEKNIPADALSRLPITEGNELNLTNNQVKSFPLDIKVIAQKQRKDKTLKNQNKNLLEKTINGTKVYCTKQGQILIPKSLQKKVLNFYHTNYGHPGATRLYESMRIAIYWRGMQTQAKSYVDKCTPCNENKRTNTKYGHLPITKAEELPWQTIQIDSFGPWNGIKGITIIDPATRFIEIHEQSDDTSETAARIVNSEWLCRYPKPIRCIHDQGPNFRGIAFRSLLEDYGIKNVPITVENPQTQGIVERSHATIANILRTTYPDEIPPQEREECLQEVAWAMRAAWHTALKASPCQVVFGRDMMFDIEYQANWMAIHEMQRKRQKQQNEQENKNRIPYKYQIGQQVLINVNPRHLSKLDKKTQGPYTVKSIRENGTVVIDKGSHTEVINIRRIKPVSSAKGPNVISKKDQGAAARSQTKTKPK
jgi:transposase InsO family protein